MNFLKKISLVALSLAAMSFSTANAQYKLPNNHNLEHEGLLASQKPMSADIKVANTLKYLSELNRVQMPDESEVYGEFWEDISVDPYKGAVIPEMMDIDVAEYRAPIDGHVTSEFGWRPRYGRIHKGIDLKLSTGDTVRAAFSGKIRLTRFERRGYGYYVVIRHDNGMETVYGHLSKFLVKPDQRVKAGDPIALGGNTGRSTGPHLHFETRYMGMAINPRTIIDFDNKLPVKDVFSFNKKNVQQALNSRPARKRTAVKKRTTAKK